MLHMLDHIPPVTNTILNIWEKVIAVCTHDGLCGESMCLKGVQQPCMQIHPGIFWALKTVPGVGFYNSERYLSVY